MSSLPGFCSSIVRRRDFAQAHDQEVWECLCSILAVSVGEESIARMSTTLPMALGGLGLRSAERSRWSAFWSSWADTLPMIKERHPEVAEVIVHHLARGGTSPCLDSARRAAVVLDGVDGFQVPSWSDVASGLRPPVIGDEDREPGVPRQGWQHAAASCVESDFRAATLMPRMNPVERTLLRSQSGPCAGVPFTTCPSSPLTRIDSALFRVLLQRRLRLPLLLSQRICGCGQPLDSFGHHRAACSRTGALGRRGFPLESAIARICREAGGRVVTNMLVRDMDLGVPAAGDSRRLEVVVDGLPLFGGVQLAIDTTLVSSVRGDGEPRRGAADTDGVALLQARKRKENTYPELRGPRARARLVVVALEVGGRWSAEAKSFVGQLAKARARMEPSDSAKDGTSVEAQMVFHLGVCRSAFFCYVSVGHEGCTWG